MRRQRITYGAGPAVLTFALPARDWTPGTVGIGGGLEFSAAGVPSSWVTRRERTLTIIQRLLETEWPAVRAWLEYAQGGGTFVWYPDAVGATWHTCYLVSPGPEEEVRPLRTEHFGAMELTFTIRRTDGAPIDEKFFP